VSDGGTLTMWYAGNSGGLENWSIGVATSQDGILWTKASQNPVFTPGTLGWESQAVATPDVIPYDGGYLMFYEGFDGSHWRIGTAVSADGRQWQRSSANPVLDLGTGFDSVWTLAPSVLVENGGFTLWYGGGGPNGQSIGRATSQDGVNWIRSSTPVIGLGQGGEPKDAYGPSVIKTDCGYFMLYTSNDSDLALASSPDGITWQRQLPYPLVSRVTGTFYSGLLQGPGALFVEGNVVRFYVSGLNSSFQIGLLEHALP
jgi:predicted GH43/DUF377 family glycosyl hydrolase